MITWLIVCFCLATPGYSEVIDQQISESQHDPQVAILKQIRKLNEDGSYTYGYEAGDGSFKVESRDVLGNIKGTFGFVDATGEVKRISYSSSNGTDFKSTTVSPLHEHISVVQSIPRNNLTLMTKKPDFYMTSTDSSTITNVIQSISRTRKPTVSPTSSTVMATTTENLTKSSIIRPKGKHRFIINGQQRPLILEQEKIFDEDSQITQPSASEKSVNMRKIIFAKRPLEHSLRPITEEFEDKEVGIKITTRNALKRQLQEETTKAAPVVEQEDHADIYGGALSTSRPLFTTTTPPRIVQRVPAHGEGRLKQIYINQNNGPAKFEQDQRSFEEQESKHNHQEDRNTAQQVLIRATTRAPTDSSDYVRQKSEPIYVRQQSEAYARDILPGGILVQNQVNHLDEDPSYRQTPLTRLLLRPELSKFLPNQLLHSSTIDANVHYITDTPPVAQEQEEVAPRIPINSYLTRQRSGYQRQLVYSDPIIDSQRILVQQFPQQPPQDERNYQNIVPDFTYRMSHLSLPPEPPNPIAPPLSRRDFQILLKRLLISQYGIQALNYPKPYLEDALYDQQPYPSYQSTYETPIPRTEVPYSSEPIASTVPAVPIVPAALSPPYSGRVPLRRSHMFSKTINPLYQQNQLEDYSEPRYQKRVYRQKFYNQEVSNEAEEILPPQIREALLLRMLQLAINAEKPIAVPNTMIGSKTVLPTRYRKSEPVRNVQILGEDIEPEKQLRKKI